MKAAWGELLREHPCFFARLQHTNARRRLHVVTRRMSKIADGEHRFRVVHCMVTFPRPARSRLINSSFVAAFNWLNESISNSCDVSCSCSSTLSFGAEYLSKPRDSAAKYADQSSVGFSPVTRGRQSTSCRVAYGLSKNKVIANALGLDPCKSIRVPLFVVRLSQEVLLGLKTIAPPVTPTPFRHSIAKAKLECDPISCFVHRFVPTNRHALITTSSEL